MTPLTSVLIVDDEPAVRDIMARWVAALGLHPTTAGNADEALETLRAHRCDLAVIDVMMPGHDGLWLANELQRDHPHTAVVIVTGYTELLDGDNEALPIADLLIKPFERDRFALAVDRGRRWRKQVLEEMQWHARLARELRDRTEDVCTRLAQVRDAEGEFLATLVGDNYLTPSQLRPTRWRTVCPLGSRSFSARLSSKPHDQPWILPVRPTSGRSG